MKCLNGLIDVLIGDIEKYKLFIEWLVSYVKSQHFIQWQLPFILLHL